MTPTEASDFAASRLPATIRVCGFTISINFMSDLKSYSEGNFAYFSSLCQEITIRKGMPSSEKLVDSLIHELNHAVFHYYGIGKDDCEERIVATLGKAWTQIFADNPGLARWIEETLNPKVPEPEPLHVEHIEWTTIPPVGNVKIRTEVGL